MIKLKQVYPYYFPTTAIFIDDDRDFLLNFSLQLDENLAYKLYDSPVKAQEHIREQTMHHDRRSYFKVQEAALEPHHNHIISLSVEDIHKEVYNPRRFSEISVIVVDYSMPGINGIDFCKSIENTSIKKILLTGRADEQLAVEAFNDRVIDRFVQKSNLKAVDLINKNIQELQAQYFKENAELMLQTLAPDSLSFINDQPFCDYFYRLCDKLNVVEHYLLDNPKGYLLLDAHGKTYILLVQTSADIQVHHEIAQDEKAPQELLDYLETGEKIPFFMHTDGFFQQSITDWQAHLYSADKITGKDSYFCALVDTVPDGFLQHEILTYDEYLDKLDFIAAK